MSPARVRFRAVTAFGLLALTLSASAPAAAQTPTRNAWSMDGRIGVVAPMGWLSHVERTGGGAGMGVVYRPWSRVGFGIDGSVDFLLGRKDGTGGLLVAKAPSMTLWNLRSGLQVWLTPPDRGRWIVTVDLLGGATIMDTDDSGPLASALPHGGADFTHAYPSLEGRLRVGYRPGPWGLVYLGGRPQVVLTSSEDTGVFSVLSSRVDPAGSSSAWTLSLEGGLQILF